MNLHDEAIQDMLKTYPGLEYIDGIQEDIFQGMIIINHLEEKSNVLLTGEFGIKIVVSKQYPEKLPVVYDINNSIDKAYVHRYCNGELCLESITRLKLFCISHSVKELSLIHISEPTRH